MRKLFSLLLALLATTTLWAYDFKSGDLYYNITSSSAPYTVEVTYERSSFNYSGLTIATIPETVTYYGTTYSVTSIGDRAFEYCSSLTSVTIGNSVTSIGDDAFYGCSSLTSITIPNSVTSIGDDAFDRCSSLTSITIPESVTSIGDRAFNRCSSLTSITIPNSVTSIGDYAFQSCSSLTSITIPNSVTSIGDYAFYDCSSLTSITIPNSVTSIGEYTFYNCSSLASVTIPNSVTSIGNYAFADCSSLTSVALPNSVMEIGNGAFYDCSSLTSVTLPNSVMEIGNGAFRNCSGLLTPVYNAHCFAYMPTSYSGAYTIPEGIEQIAGVAFDRCSSLTSITIPNSVTSIGESAFYDCSSLTSITIPNSVASIGSSVLAFCDALVAISVDPTNTIYDSRENCNGIVETKTNSLVAGCQTTILPNSLETIKCGAMSYCRNLGSVYIPKSVTTIETASFCSCASLVSIVVDKDNPMYDSRNNCNAIIESSTDNLITGCQKTIIPHDVISIHDSAFLGCTSLSSIVIPHNVKSIGEDAFGFCWGLASVTFGNNLTTIGDGAFFYSNNIKSIYCYAINPPEIYNNTFSPYFYFSNPILYVPCEVLDDYKNNYDWSNYFTDIQCISSDEVSTNDVTVTPGSNDVTITWPTEDDAETYSIVIKKDGKVVCTLTFNSEGQLLNIAFAPSRNGNHPAQYAEAVANGKGFRFTVTGLEDGTDYTYDITVKDASNKTIKSHSGEFTTQSTTAVDNITTNNANIQKIMRNGQLIILRDGVEYNAIGQEL